LTVAISGHARTCRTLRSHGLARLRQVAMTCDVTCALSRDFGVDHDEYPALRRWARRFRKLPGFLTMPGIPDYH
jgi:hypothetical protein